MVFKDFSVSEHQQSLIIKSLNKQGVIIKSRFIEVYYYDEALIFEEGKSSATLRRQKTQGNAHQERQRAKSKSNEDENTIRMVFIPEGEFWMGTPDEEIERLNKKYDTDAFNRERPQHLVTLQSFYMSQTSITQAQWRAIASRTDLKVNLDLKTDPSNFKGDNRPVEQVNWEEAVEFCQRLSKLTGKVYKLPSEAQWEYACRAVIREGEASIPSEGNVGAQDSSSTSEGLTQKKWNEKYHQPFHFGETIITDLANYDGNYNFAGEPKGEFREETTPVNRFSPNAFGLYNMHGNVWEWCEDNYVDNYEDTPKDGSAYINKSMKIIVLRGGSWMFFPQDCRSAFRYFNLRNNRYDSFGFRVVCVVGKTP